MKYTITFDNKLLEEYTADYFIKYPRRHKPPIANPLHPSINTWFIMKRPQMNDLKQKWSEFTKWIVEKHGFENLHIQKARITFIYYFKTKARHDADNLTPKFVMDGFTECGLIEDDDFSHIETLTIASGGHCKEDPKMVVEIETIDEVKLIS